ncbi:MAG: hypothetical protein RI995_1149 [Bacteroidota bacterium]|jgi:hypothetical protein
MKTLKKTFYVVATLLAVNFATNAQDFNPEAMAQRQMDRMESELKLSKDQAKKIWPLIQTNVEKMMEMRQSGLGMDQMREAMQKNGQAMMENLSSILTPEQIEKYKEMQARMRQGGGGFGQRPQN